MKQDYLTRQADILPLKSLRRYIEIVGCGAVGSCAAMALAKSGFEYLSLWDDDVVSEENMNCQLYPTLAIGKPKAFYLRKLLKAFADVDASANQARWYKKDNMPLDIVIMSVDSMTSRLEIAKSCNANWIIDPRMGAEEASIVVTNGNDSDYLDEYKKYWYSDRNATAEACTAKATSYTAFMLGGLVAKIVKDIATGVEPVRSYDWSIKNDELIAFKKEYANGRTEH